MTTDNHHTAGNIKLHNLINTQATNYHYTNNTITMNTTDHYNDQSCHNIRIWQWENNKKVHMYLATPDEVTYNICALVKIN